MPSTFVNELLTECISRWGNDHHTINLGESIESCLTYLHEDKKQTVFINLLKNFNYYSPEKIDYNFTQLYSSYMQLEPKIDESIFMPVKSPEGRFNHSYDMLSKFQHINRLDKMLCPVDFETVIQKYPLDSIKNIVLIDDIIGTGKTIYDSLTFSINKFGDLLKQKKIYILVLEALEHGITKIEQFALDAKVNIKIVPAITHHKAFEANYIFNDMDVLDARRIMLEQERIVMHNPEYHLGYKQSEALIAFFYDTPNNTISSFWCDERITGWYALFPRQKNVVVPSWSKDVKEKARRQGKVNYQIKKLGGKSSRGF